MVVISCVVDFRDQLEGFCLIMPVEINQWRATSECVLVSIQILPPISKNIRLFPTVSYFLELYWFCYSFIATSIIALPLASMLLFVVRTLRQGKCVFCPCLSMCIILWKRYLAKAFNSLRKAWMLSFNYVMISAQQ